MLPFLWVFLGGGLGSVLRYGISLAMPRQVGAFPWATLLTNLLACVLLSVLWTLAMQASPWMNTRNKLLFATGFCGGFSTFSTFTAELFDLWLGGHTISCVMYAFTSLAGCLVGFWLGYKITLSVLV